MYHPFFVCIWLKNSIFGEFWNIYLFSAQNRGKWRHKIRPIAKNFRSILIFFARDDAKLMPGEVCQVSCWYSNKRKKLFRKNRGGGSDPTPPPLPGGGGLILHYTVGTAPRRQCFESRSATACPDLIHCIALRSFNVQVVRSQLNALPGRYTTPLIRHRISYRRCLSAAPGRRTRRAVSRSCAPLGAAAGREVRWLTDHSGAVSRADLSPVLTAAVSAVSALFATVRARPGPFRPVKTASSGGWRRVWRDGTGRDALGRSQTEPKQRWRMRWEPGLRRARRAEDELRLNCSCDRRQGPGYMSRKMKALNRCSCKNITETKT